MSLNHSQRTDYIIGLILYHPEESLLKRIDQMINLGFRIYVFDNSPFDSKFNCDMRENPNIFYLTAGENVGIAFSLSTLCATAYAHGYQRLLYLDQDTGVSPQTFEFIEEFSKSLSASIQKQYAALVFSGSPGADKCIQEVSLAIGSGSLFNLEALRQIGWHNKNYFADCVDYELCIRARRRGLKIGLIKNTPDFDHVTEQPDRTLIFLGYRLSLRMYSLTRIQDAMISYTKLVSSCFINMEFRNMLYLTRSASIYIGGQVLSRLLKF